MTPSRCPRRKFSICVMFVCLHPFASSNCTTTVHTTLRACWHRVLTSLQSTGQLPLWPSSNLWSSFFRIKASLKTVVSWLNALWGNSLFYMKVEEHRNIATEKKIKLQTASHSWAYGKMLPLRRMWMPLRSGHLSISYIWVFSCVLIAFCSGRKSTCNRQFTQPIIPSMVYIILAWD